jgi:[protein-PII] uridylyltransferase
VYSPVERFQLKMIDLGITKIGLKEMKTRMAQGAPTPPSPKELLRQHSEIMDGLVRKAFQKAQANLPSPSVCLMAVGGYGRAELAPYSDTDLLLVHSTSNRSDLSPLIERTLYPLWDLGLEVSCSSRTIEECMRMAQSDLQAKTALIDGRYLDGEYEFFRALYGLFTKKVLHHRVHDFADELMKDLHLRHQKYGDPNYVLEPNLKEGEGGLRDFQIGRWVLRAKYTTDRWESILFPDQARTLDRSLQFLWAIRNELHLLSQRRQDDLTFELQEKIAPLLGFSPSTKGIEEMMRQYHLSTQKILNFATGVLERALSEPSLFRKTTFYFKRGKIDDNFATRNGELCLLDPVTFKKDPSQLMTLFAHCQSYRIKMDFQAEEAVMEALPFIDDRFRTSQRMNQTFSSILRKGEGLGAILKKMHELGFLSRYIPEFSEIEGKIHYDLYHVHPVDVHSLLAVEELVRLRNGDYQEEHPLLTSLIREMDNPEILFLTTLLHDIGKGTEGDQSLVGAEMASSIGGRMGFSAEETELIHFLVKHHLFMLETALRRDLHDEQAIFNFGNKVQSLLRLKMLYLLTFADVKAVGPEAWTTWKDSLLMELFIKTSHALERGDRTVYLSEEAMADRLKKVLPPGRVEEVECLPARYLSSYSEKEILHHLEMARSLEKELLTVVEWEIGETKRARVTLCTKDRYGLFSKIAGSMFINRLDILEAQIHTWSNGIALDTFHVEDVTGDAERRLLQFKKDLDNILSSAVSLKDFLSPGKESNGVQKKVMPRVDPEVRINNQDSDFYTIIEVTGEDRLGILYEITKALTDHGCDIHFARISTLGNRIVDVFYAQDTLGEKIEGKEKEDHLRQTLLKQIIP